jgi:pimeloyl-ACP methyl ester carboxylesterase
MPHGSDLSAVIQNPASPAERTVRLPDGRLLGYADYGDPSGVPIFGLHGTPGSRFMFQIAHPAAMEAGVRLLAPERPGFGISSFHANRTLKNYADDIENFAGALGIGQFAVVGVSGGGPYAAACAAFLPDRITALGLVSPVGPMRGLAHPASLGLGHRTAFCFLPEMPFFLAGAFGFGRLAFLYTPGLIFGLILSRAANSDRKILLRTEVRANLLRGVAEGCRPGIAASLQDMHIFSRCWDIPFEKITAPAFLWQGLSDRNVPVGAALKLGELIRGCQVYQIEKAGHYWIFDHISEVIETTLKAARRPSPAIDRI